MDELEFYDGAWTGQEIDAGIGLTGTLANALAIVVDGNKAAVSAAAGQYVLVKNSTITSISDGLYKAAQAIPANTAIDATYLTAVSRGGLNATQLPTTLPNSKQLPFTADDSGLALFTVTANSNAGGDFILRDNTTSTMVASCHAKANLYGMAWFYCIKGHEYAVSPLSDAYYSAVVRPYYFGA